MSDPLRSRLCDPYTSPVPPPVLGSTTGPTVPPSYVCGFGGISAGLIRENVRKTRPRTVVVVGQSPRGFGEKEETPDKDTNNSM